LPLASNYYLWNSSRINDTLESVIQGQFSRRRSTGNFLPAIPGHYYGQYGNEYPRTSTPVYAVVGRKNEFSFPNTSWENTGLYRYYPTPPTIVPPSTVSWMRTGWKQPGFETQRCGLFVPPTPYGIQTPFGTDVDRAVNDAIPCRIAKFGASVSPMFGDIGSFQGDPCPTNNLGNNQMFVSGADWFDESGIHFNPIVHQLDGKGGPQFSGSQFTEAFECERITNNLSITISPVKLNHAGYSQRINMELDETWDTSTPLLPFQMYVVTARGANILAHRFFLGAGTNRYLHYGEFPSPWNTATESYGGRGWLGNDVNAIDKNVQIDLFGCLSSDDPRNASAQKYLTVGCREESVRSGESAEAYNSQMIFSVPISTTPNTDYFLIVGGEEKDCWAMGGMPHHNKDHQLLKASPNDYLAIVDMGFIANSHFLGLFEDLPNGDQPGYWANVLQPLGWYNCYPCDHRTWSNEPDSRFLNHKFKDRQFIHQEWINDEANRKAAYGTRTAPNIQVQSLGANYHFSGNMPVNVEDSHGIIENEKSTQGKKLSGVKIGFYEVPFLADEKPTPNDWAWTVIPEDTDHNQYVINNHEYIYYGRQGIWDWFHGGLVGSGAAGNLNWWEDPGHVSHITNWQNYYAVNEKTPAGQIVYENRRDMWNVFGLFKQRDFEDRVHLYQPTVVSERYGMWLNYFLYKQAKKVHVSHFYAHSYGGWGINTPGEIFSGRLVGDKWFWEDTANKGNYPANIYTNWSYQQQYYTFEQWQNAYPVFIQGEYDFEPFTHAGIESNENLFRCLQSGPSVEIGEQINFDCIIKGPVPEEPWEVTKGDYDAGIEAYREKIGDPEFHWTYWEAKDEYIPHPLQRTPRIYEYNPNYPAALEEYENQIGITYKIPHVYYYPKENSKFLTEGTASTPKVEAYAQIGWVQAQAGKHPEETINNFEGMNDHSYTQISSNPTYGELDPYTDGGWHDTGKFGGIPVLNPGTSPYAGVDDDSVKPRLSLVLSIRSEHNLSVESKLESACHEKEFTTDWPQDWNENRSMEPLGSHTYFYPGMFPPSQNHAVTEQMKRTWGRFTNLKTTDEKATTGLGSYRTYQKLLSAEETVKFLNGEQVVFEGWIKYGRDFGDINEDGHVGHPYVQNWQDSSNTYRHELAVNMHYPSQRYRVSIQGNFS